MIRAIPVVIAVLATSVAGCVVKVGGGSTVLNLDGIALEGRASRTVETPLTIGEGERLFVSTSFGKVIVETFESLAPRAEARLSIQGETEEDARRALDGYVVTTRKVPGGVRLVVEGKPLVYERDGTTTTLSANVDLNIIVAPGTSIDIETGSGEIRVKGPVADLTAKSNFGDIEVEGARGAIRLSTGSGDVKLTGVADGRLRLSSNFGEVMASGVLLVVAAEAGSGDVEIAAMPGSRVTEPWHLRSNFGDVELKLPTDCPCSIRATSNFGSIHIEVPAGGAASGSDDTSIYTGDIAGGGHVVGIDAGSGDIRITRSE